MKETRTFTIKPGQRIVPALELYNGCWGITVSAPNYLASDLKCTLTVETMETGEMEAPKCPNCGAA